MKLTLGFSPCPNDTFIFDALVNRKIDTEGFEFEPVLEDVETLNQWALQGKLDITKLSLPAFFQSTREYVLLNSGSALGKGVGPLLITLKQEHVEDEDVNRGSIAIPGVNTTANLLFSFAYPEAVNKTFMIFSAIEGSVLSGESDFGVIIHENRFTYQQRGLSKVKDLGSYWESRMGVPIPLGAIAARRRFDAGATAKIDRLIRSSLEYSFSHYPLITDYVRAHAQEMSEDVMRQHIDLYVNDYSIELGTDGKKAIETLRNVFNKVNSKSPLAGDQDLFL